MGEKEYDSLMHSAEHLLNQTMDRMFGCGRAFSSHIERKKSKCDYKFHRMVTTDELSQIEHTVNEIISLNLDVSESFVPRIAAMQQFNLSRVPESAGDAIRIVRIGDYDSCPCIGPHVENTSQIGRFKIISADYIESADNSAGGVLRIRFKREEV
jgi:alanyl-tRNA synthetase